MANNGWWKVGYLGKWAKWNDGLNHINACIHGIMDIKNQTNQRLQS